MRHKYAKAMKMAFALFTINDSGNKKNLRKKVCCETVKKKRLE